MPSANSRSNFVTDNSLYIDYEGTIVDTGLVFDTGKWHTVGISFNEETVRSEFEEIQPMGLRPPVTFKHYLYLRIFLDDQVYATVYRHTDTAQSRTIMIGRTFEDKGSASNSFGGLMETLVLCNKYITQDEFVRMAAKLNCLTKESSFDEFGMYQGSEIRKSGTSILSNKLTYKSLDKTENGRTYKQLSKVVAAETITAGGTTLADRAYTTDNLGRVTGITDSKFGNHSYEYDCKGFLVKDGDTVYEYDANGNVTKIGNTVLEYDSVVKDKLVKVGGKVVAYDANNPLVPTSYDGNTYTFEGRRLARIQKGGKVIDYTYNDQGLRIKKTITENGTSLETRFFYDGAKLITEITPEHRLDFLYDENDRLYGFVFDKTAMYFYMRDTLENILGIIDKNGNLVVQYAYNAWGKIQSITGTLATTVGEYNPFRYKGYHFDSDTGMYYCHTRYYVPDWCRWLCADGVIGLDPFGLFDQNLYCYCGNDPVNYFDPTGHSAILIGLIIGAIIGAAAGFGLATYKDYKDDGKVFNGSVEWYEYVGLTIAGGVIGGGLGAGAGYIASSIGASFAAGGLSFSSSGAAAMLSSCQTTFVEIASVIGAGVLFASTNRPGDNRKQNEQYREAMRRLGFSKNDWQWRYGHDHLPQKSMGFKELVDFLRSLFSKLK